jgi:uncharacterized protein (TIGR03437 family)
LTIASSGRRLSAPKELSAKPGDTMRFQVAASRSDAISAFGLPPGSRFDAATAAFEWTPTSADLGRHEITFLAAAVPGTPEVHTVVVNIGSGLPVLTGLRNLAGAALCSPTTIAGITGRFLAEGGDTRVRVNGEYATVLAASGDRTDFLCPDLPAGSPLDIAVETPAGQSNILHTTIEDVAPAILTMDDTPEGQALATHANSMELAALPNFRFRARPVLPGEPVSLSVTGIACDGSRQPQLKVGGQYIAIDSIRPSAQMPAVCTVAFRAPAGTAGDFVPVVFETIRADGTVAVSNPATIAIEAPAHAGDFNSKE